MIAAVSQPETLRREDAARYLGFSTRMLDRYVARGLIQRLKIGTRTAFRPVDLDAFLSKRETQAALLSDVLTREQAANYLSVSIRMVDKLARNGDLPKVKNGLRTVFRLVDLETFIASRLVRSVRPEVHA